MFFRLFFISIIGLSLVPSLTNAVDLDKQINSQIGAAMTGVTGKAPVAAKAPQEIIAEVIKVILSILGMFFMILILFAGYWYLTAKGEEEKVEKAVDTIRSAIIGLAIVLLSYTITLFVSSKFKAAVQVGGSTQRDTVSYEEFYEE